jgi:hypothetical protein
MRSRASLYWSRSHRNLARRDRARLSTHGARVPLSLAEVVRVSAVAFSHRNLARRDRARLSTYHPRIRTRLSRLRACHSTLASQSRSPRSRAPFHLSRPHRNLARRDRARLCSLLAISLAEIACVSHHISRSHLYLARRDYARLCHSNLASQSRLPRSRSSFNVSQPRRYLARRARVRLCTFAPRSRSRRSRASLHVRPSSPPLTPCGRIVISLADITRLVHLSRSRHNLAHEIGSHRSLAC